MIVLLSMESSGIIETLESTEAATKKQCELKQAKVATLHCIAGTLRVQVERETICLASVINACLVFP